MATFIAGLIGGLYGLVSLVFPYVVIASKWHEMEPHLKIYVLFLPSIVATIGVLVGMAMLRVLIVRLFHHIRGTTPIDEFAFMRDDPDPVKEHQRSYSFILWVWLAVGIGLYALCEIAFS